MDKQQAQDIVRETFESPFDKGRFTIFAKNILNKQQPITIAGQILTAKKQHTLKRERQMLELEMKKIN